MKNRDAIYSTTLSAIRAKAKVTTDQAKALETKVSEVLRADRLGNQRAASILADQLEAMIADFTIPKTTTIRHRDGLVAFPA